MRLATTTSQTSLILTTHLEYLPSAQQRCNLTRTQVPSPMTGTMRMDTRIGYLPIAAEVDAPPAFVTGTGLPVWETMFRNMATMLMFWINCYTEGSVWMYHPMLKAMELN